MRRARRIFILTIAVVICFYGHGYCSEFDKSTLDDQLSVEVTVYNNNLGLVKDTRAIELSDIGGELRFMDVASYIMPVTVHVKSLNQADEFSVLEQNYEYDLMDADKLLDKYVGKKIKIVDFNKFQDKKEEVEAELLSNNNGQIFKIKNEIYLGHPGYKILPEIPENLIAKPTLTWIYSNTGTRLQDIEVSYLTKNMNWKADYVFILNKDDTLAELKGWVSLDNKSGVTYGQAKLKLVAGEVNRVKRERHGYAEDRMFMAKFGVAEGGFKEEAFFEYHIYDLARKTTIKNNQTKQISLLEANDVGIKKELLVYGSKDYFRGKHGRGEKIKSPVNVYIKFKNSKENNLGMPLPAGIMRLYKQDSSESLQFIGEDKIEHTPLDEEIKLKIGKSFDVVAQRSQLDFQRFGQWVNESEWEIVIKNHKKEDIVVGVVEPIYGDWKIVSSTHDYQKVDAFTARFDVNVPKDGSAKIVYKVRVKHR